MIYGYTTDSAGAGDLAGQISLLRAAGCGRVFSDKMNGTRGARPQLSKLLVTLTRDDIVIIPAVNRLSRNTADLLVIAKGIKRAGAGFRSLAEPVLDTTSDFAEQMLAILGIAAKLERRQILERAARGRTDAKAQGVQFGRKPKLTQSQQREARSRLEAGETQRNVARSYDVSQATISRLAP